MEILLVEDNYSDIFLFKMFLEDIERSVKLRVIRDGASVTGYLVNTAIKENHNLPDLIVLDLNLPNENGFEILSEIKSNPLLRDLNVLIFTTSAEIEDKLYAMKLGAMNFLTKPCDINEFEKAMQIIYYSVFNDNRRIMQQ
ncbi:MAG: response regulator [Bacillota bacterium]